MSPYHRKPVPIIDKIVRLYCVSVRLFCRVARRPWGRGTYITNSLTFIATCPNVGTPFLKKNNSVAQQLEVGLQTAVCDYVCILLKIRTKFNNGGSSTGVSIGEFFHLYSCRDLFVLLQRDFSFSEYLYLYFCESVNFVLLKNDETIKFYFAS